MYFLWYLLIGLAAGWIASLIFKGSGSGLLVNLIVGLVGGFLGGWLVSLFGIAQFEKQFSDMSVMDVAGVLLNPIGSSFDYLCDR